MNNEFLGYHSEWNLGSPGGWDYQRMAQEIARFSWGKIKKETKIDIELDFDHAILNPVPLFAQMLLRAHKRNFGKTKPFIALIAEEETLEKVGENIRFVDYLNSLAGVKAVLISANRLEERGGSIYVGENKVTVIFLDFNNSVIVKLKKKYKIDALFSAIKQGIVINPRGMEPVGSKGIFEIVTSDFKDLLNESTVKRTPWTRQFYPRSVTGPDGEDIPDLIKWTKDNWQDIILKPVHGYSGHGIIIGHKSQDIDGSVKEALDSGDYIIQQLVPMALWAEEFPWVDREKKEVYIKRWQTDFRCFATDKGPIGFVTRFGGIPTNVGSGGGVQSAAILRTKVSVKDAIARINDTILKLGFDFLVDLQNQIDEKSVKIGNIYLLGPIMSTLRPRIVTQQHIQQIKKYTQNLWDDAVKLESLWLEGKLAKYVQISEEEEQIAKMAPWKGDIALLAADGLFNFTNREEDFIS